MKKDPRSLVKKPEDTMQFSTFTNVPKIKTLINNALGENRNQFVTAVLSAISANSELMKCDNASVLSSALTGAALGLSPSPQMGHFYIIPFKKKDSAPFVQDLYTQS